MLSVKILFNASYHILVQKNSEGIYDLSEILDENFNWHDLTERIACAIVSQSENLKGDWQTIYNLSFQSMTPELTQILAEIDDQLYRLPYLEMGKYDYIYRFRTEKERNRSVYVDSQSQFLYQSALCQAIKVARRTKERSSGEPVVIDFGAVEYIIPSHFGFCLGVQNAIERAYETVAMNPNRRVFMLSELIHNPFVNKDLIDRGLRYLQTDKGLPLRSDGSIAKSREEPEAFWNLLNKDDIVIIPAFGATNEDKAQLIKRGISIRENDATCMLVEKVWKAARGYAKEGYTVIIHGKSEHEETKATFSNATSVGPALVIRNMEDAKRLAEVIGSDDTKKKELFDTYFSNDCSDGFDSHRDLDKIAVVNQTTLLRNETVKIIDYLREIIIEKFGESKAEEHICSNGKSDTLCYATQVNQDALQKGLDHSIDAALVVGGKNSSNTYQLYRVCAERLDLNAHYIQSERDLHSIKSVRHYIFPNNPEIHPESSEQERPLLQTDKKKPRILITGGASCPDGIIQQVLHRLNSFFPSDQLRPIEAVLEDFESLE